MKVFVQNTILVETDLAFSFMKESEEYMRALEALEEETMRLRTQAAEAEEEKVVVLKLNNDLKKEVSFVTVIIILSFYSSSHALVSQNQSLSSFHAFLSLVELLFDICIHPPPATSILPKFMHVLLYSVIICFSLHSHNRTQTCFSLNLS